MNFGEALEALKNGEAISRAGWNGKGMYVYLNKGSYDFGRDNVVPESVEGVSTSLFENGHENTSTRLPNINMKTATGSHVTGWLASQTDLLCSDWGIVNY